MIKEAYDSCSKALEQVTQTGRSELATSHCNRQRVVSAAAQAYATAVGDAVNAYLSRVKAVWAGIDRAGAEPRTLTNLAAASLGAAHAPQAASAPRA